MPYYTNTKRRNFRRPIFLLALILFLGFFWGIIVPSSLTKGTAEIKVVEKVSHPQDGFLIFAENETFCVDDSMLDGIWDSSDIFRELKVGQRYRIETRGARIPFLSFYRKIIKAIPIPN